MSIIFVIICRDFDKVLCEYTDYNGNFEQVTRSILKRIKTTPKASIQYGDEYLFHFQTEENLTYLCMCDNKYPIETAFEFLNAIKESFLKTFKKEVISTAYAYSFNRDFRNTLQNKMKFFNNNNSSKSDDQIERFKKGLIDTKNTLLDCDDLLGKRGEKVQLIVKKAELLQADSIDFFEGALKVKQRYRKRCTRIIIACFAILLLVYLIISFKCGFTFRSCVKK